MSAHVRDEDLGATTHGSTAISTAKTTTATKAGAKSTTETTTGSAHATTTATASVEAGLGLAVLWRKSASLRLDIKKIINIPRERR